jgi:Tol biopolymer transport system component
LKDPAFSRDASIETGTTIEPKETKMKLSFSRLAPYPDQKSPIRAFMAMLIVLLFTAGLPLQAAKGGRPGGGGGSGNPKIAYIDSGPALKVMDADGANPRVVFAPKSALGLAHPAWHPNGQQIFFSFRPKHSVGHGIYRINIDGTGLIEILPPVPKGEDYSVGSSGDFMGEISPIPINGRYRIIFRRERTDPKYIPHSYIFAANENGGDVTQLTFGYPSDRWGGQERWPAWAPNGQSIAYTSSEGLHHLNLEQDIAGNITAGEDLLLLVRDSIDVAPAFQPISCPAFSMRRNVLYFIIGESELWSLDLDGQTMGPLPLTPFEPVQRHVNSVSESADGTRIVYSTRYYDALNQFIGYGIEVANSDGTNPVIVATPAYHSSMPCFKR